MKTLTRLCLVIVMVAVASTMVYAGRPQCSAMTRPGICFDDDSNYPLLGFVEGDPVTTRAYALIWENGNDFLMYRPDGTSWWHATDVHAALYVCPVEGVLPGPPGTPPAGYGRCMQDWFASPTWPEPTPEMWAGESRFTFAVTWAADFSLSCPSMLHSRGTAVDASGQPYLVTGDAAWIKTPGAADGCTLMFEEIEFTAQ